MYHQSLEKPSPLTVWMLTASSPEQVLAALHQISGRRIRRLWAGFLALAAIWAMFPWLASAQSRFEYNGITHVSWWFDEYTYPTATASRDALVATGANWAAVLVTWYQDTITSTTIASHPQRTPTPMAVRTAIEELHNKGLKVMLKPHVDLLSDGQWRGNINPTNIDDWFASYTQFMLQYAQMAQELRVEAFCIGTELKTISGAANRARWIGVADSIRSVYDGLLTYAANATSAADEFTSVSFWDRLDLVGLDAYFPLTNRTDPSLADLVAAWRRNRWGEDPLAAVQNFADSRQKPLVFTEIGYRSVAGANTEPWNFSLPGSYDPTEQQDCYEAVYTVWSQQSSWMKGLFWWAWPVPVPAANDTDYNPRGKPAESVLRTWQIPETSRNSISSALQQRRGQMQTDQEARTNEVARVRSHLPQSANAQSQPALTTLLDAVRTGQQEAVRQLLAAGVSANSASPAGRTPLIEAAEHGQVDIARLLIESGADLNISQRGWGTALETAERTGQTEVAVLLRRAGARTSGRSVGDSVCVRPWLGNGYCGVVEEVNKTNYRIHVTELINCTGGCAAKAECSEGRPVGGPNGIQVSEVVKTVSSCLTHTGVQP